MKKKQLTNERRFRKNAYLCGKLTISVVKLPPIIIDMLARRAGHELRLPADCEHLALDIQSRTGEHVGAALAIIGLPFIIVGTSFGIGWYILIACVGLMFIAMLGTNVHTQEDKS